MALIDSNSKMYFRVESVDPLHGYVTLRVYKNKEHRDGGDTPFTKSYTETVYVPESLLEMECEPGKLIDNLKRLAYLALKKNPVYSSMLND